MSFHRPWLPPVQSFSVWSPASRKHCIAASLHVSYKFRQVPLLTQNRQSHSRRWDLAVLVALAAVGAGLYSPIFGILPLSGDNLYVLAWVDQAPVTALLGLDPEIYPEWRPLAYWTIWIEHAAIQLRVVSVHFGVNLALWVTCAWLVYRLVGELGGSQAAAAFAGVLLLIDRRSVESLTWIVERQSTLACALGLAAGLMVVRAPAVSLTWRDRGVVALLLLGSALGKEYGLAFTGALVCYGWNQHRRDLVQTGVAVAVVYAGLRVMAAGGATGLYCEDMGYFNQTYEACVDPLTGQGLGQLTYNVVANAVGIAVQGIFDNEGMIQVEPRRLALGLTMFALAMVGVVFGDLRLRLLALVPVFNALLGAMLYRHRNQLVGVCAMTVAVGIGLSLLHAPAFVGAARRQFAGAVLATLIALAALHGVTTRARVINEVHGLRGQDPCEAGLRRHNYGDRFAQRVKAAFGLDDPNCLETPAAY